jgi:hypothetical protein
VEHWGLDLSDVLPPPSTQKWTYHLQECDNRLRVVISMETNKCLYVGLEHLSDEDNRWAHYPGVTIPAKTESIAEDLARQLYYGDWKVHMLYSGASVKSVPGLNYRIIDKAEEFRLGQIAKDREAGVTFDG